MEKFKKEHGNYDCSEIDPDLYQWEFLKEDTKKDSNKFIVGTTGQILMIRDYFICFFIIVFMKMPVLQIFPNLAMFATSLFITFKYRPFENKFMNFLTVINETAYVLILSFFLVLLLLGAKISPE